MDPGLPEATAVATADGRIFSVGTLEELGPWLKRYPHTIDRRFANKVLYPGFVEAHGHPILGGTAMASNLLTALPTLRAYDSPFPGIKSKDEVIVKLKEYDSKLANPSDLLFAWGYDVSAMGGPIDRAFLDKVSKSRPILVWDSSEHNVFANTAALKHYDLDLATAKKTLGVGLTEQGELSGSFLGVSASTLIMRAAMRDVFKPSQLLSNMQYQSDLAQQHGLTTMSELSLGSLDVEQEVALVKNFTKSKFRNQRLVTIVNGPNLIEAYSKEAPTRARALEQENNDYLIFKGVKYFADDAYLANTMKVANPRYTDWHDGVIFYKSTKEFADHMSPFWDSGFHIHVHSNGSLGNALTLAALQELQNRKPRFDHRFTFEHYGISSSSDARKVKALGAVVSVNPAYGYMRAHVQSDSLGTDRASLATRMGTLLREGVVVSMHTDTPVAPPLPLTEVWFAVNRRELYSGQLVAPAEKISVYQALRMVTIDAAYTLGVEDKVGSIEAGKYADFVVLDSDPQSSDPRKIKDIPVIATILGGAVTMTSETKKPRG
ncbi:MAG: amidohydrolase [Deltaproteobacteria bacterium]|nr:amidohydrolase [Deltaproteobacteria bacterium]